MQKQTDKRDFISIKIASPEDILSWSTGEIKKSETVNYRTSKPENDGLLCEKIFGTTKNYQCRCGRYRKEKDIGKICEDCGVQVTHSRVRRERMGHIALAAPVVHFWYFRNQNSYVATLLNMKPREVASIIYCQKYVVIDPKDTPLEKKQVLTDKQYAQVFREFGKRAEIGIGGEAIQKLLKEIDLDELSKELTEEMEVSKKTGKKELAKRLRLVEDFRKSGNRPEWMVFDNVPVLPADLRPLVQLDGGRFATSDLNDLYRRIINRNNRLKILQEQKAPSLILENEIRMLQSAVDALISNGRTSRPVTGAGKRELKSLSSYLEGKGGRFRQNLLGKRVDYSGRSVIISGPKLKLHQCGIPREMALELYKPFIMNQMVNLGYVETFKQARKTIDNRSDKMWDVLEQIVKHHPVVLNRAPTLHKLSVRAFEPVIIEGKAIQLHPLMCSGFNADFDGDTMSVHIPISREAQAEARILLMGTKNLLHPQSGKTSTSPSQDMILGCYYLSLEEKGAKGEGKYFASIDDALTSYDNDYLDIHAKIIVDVRNEERVNGKKHLVTTIGKILFNQGLPKEIPYVNNGVVDFSGRVEGAFDDIEEAVQYLQNKENKLFDDSFLGEFISLAFNEFGENVMVPLLDEIKEKGFRYSTKSGLTFSLKDIVLPEDKWDIVNEVSDEMNRIEKNYLHGRLSKDDRHDFVVSLWDEVSKKVAASSIIALENSGFNPIYMMIDSGARGSKNQYRQLAAMRGLMADPSGKTIERPILANFKEGLDEFDYFISSHGARKGMADTAIKTADAGYLTRKLVDVAHDVVVNQDDCETEQFITVEAIDPQSQPPTETLEERIIGRVLAQDLVVGEEVMFEKGTLLTKVMAKEIAKRFKRVSIRSVLTCEAERGICKQCYGYDLSNNRLVEKGEAVGVIAAQSIGEPGTQLTMRTFHSGGVAGNDITQGLPRITEILEARQKVKGAATLAKEEGRVHIIEKGRIKDILLVNEEGEETVYKGSLGIGLEVEEGQWVKKGQRLTAGSIRPHELLELTSMEEVQKYLLEEVQRVYRVQGVQINDKHVEVIIRQISKKVQVVDSGDSEIVMGEIFESGYIKKLNKQLVAEGKRAIETNPILMGITAASLATDSFLSAASFQETSKVLMDAAVKGKRDYILGLKEAVILGRNIPAGTGFHEYLEEFDVV